MKWSKVALFIFFVIIVKVDAAEETDLEKCKKYMGFCASVTVTRKVLNSTDNEFFKVENAGPNATLHVLQGFDESTSKKYIEFDHVALDKTGPEYYEGVHGALCPFLQTNPAKPYAMARQLLRMLFDQYKECSSESKEYTVPTGFSGVFSFYVKPPCGGLETTVKLREDKNSEIADLTMIVEIVPDNDTANECR